MNFGYEARLLQPAVAAQQMRAYMAAGGKGTSPIARTVPPELQYKAPEGLSPQGEERLKEFAPDLVNARDNIISEATGMKDGFVSSLASGIMGKAAPALASAAAPAAAGAAGLGAGAGAASGAAAGGAAAGAGGAGLLASV